MIIYIIIISQAKLRRNNFYNKCIAALRDMSVDFMMSCGMYPDIKTLRRTFDFADPQKPGEHPVFQGERANCLRFKWTRDTLWVQSKKPSAFDIKKRVRKWIKK